MGTSSSDSNESWQEVSEAGTPRSSGQTVHPRSTQAIKILMSVTGLLECGLLVLGGLLLMLGLPFLIRHAIDRLTALVLGHRHAAGVSGLLHPVRQAIAAEGGENHPVDVLHVGARARMLQKAPERGGPELCGGLFVERHGRMLLFSLPRS